MPSPLSFRHRLAAACALAAQRVAKDDPEGENAEEAQDPKSE